MRIRLPAWRQEAGIIPATSPAEDEFAQLAGPTLSAIRQLQLRVLSLDFFKRECRAPGSDEHSIVVREFLPLVETLLRTHGAESTLVMPSCGYLEELRRNLCEIATGLKYPGTDPAWRLTLEDHIQHVLRQTSRQVALTKKVVGEKVSGEIDRAVEDHPTFIWLRNPSACCDLAFDGLGYPPLGPFTDWLSLVSGDNPLAKLYGLDGIAKKLTQVRASHSSLEIFLSIVESAEEVYKLRKYLRAANAGLAALHLDHYEDLPDREAFVKALDAGLRDTLGPDLADRMLNRIDTIHTQATGAAGNDSDSKLIEEAPALSLADRALTAGRDVVTSASEVLQGDFTVLKSNSGWSRRKNLWDLARGPLTTLGIMDRAGRLLPEENLLTEIIKEKFKQALSRSLSGARSLTPFSDYVNSFPSIFITFEILNDLNRSQELLPDLSRQASVKLERVSDLRRRISETLVALPVISGEVSVRLGGTFLDAGANRIQQFTDQLAALALLRLGVSYAPAAKSYHEHAFMALKFAAKFNFETYDDGPLFRAVRRNLGDLSSMLGEELSMWLRDGPCLSDNVAGGATAEAGMAQGDTWGRLNISIDVPQALNLRARWHLRIQRNRIARLRGILPEQLIAESLAANVPLNLCRDKGFNFLVRLGCAARKETPPGNWDTLCRAYENYLSEALGQFLLDDKVTAYVPDEPPLPWPVKAVTDRIVERLRPLVNRMTSTSGTPPGPVNRFMKKLLTPNFRVRVSIEKIGIPKNDAGT